MTSTTALSNTGLVTSVRGSVVDVRFQSLLPPIHALLQTGSDGEVAVEVMAQQRERFLDRIDEPGQLEERPADHLHHHSRHLEWTQDALSDDQRKTSWRIAEDSRTSDQGRLG